MKYFSQFYSCNPPDYAISYPWDLDLRNDMSKFFEACKTEVVHTDRFEDVTFWVDICFINQNSENIASELLVSQENYRTSMGHFVFLAKRPFARGWILFELAFRLFSIMTELGMTFEEMLGYLTCMVGSDGDATTSMSEDTPRNKFKSRRTFQEYSLDHVLKISFPQIVICEGITDLQTDLYDYCGKETFGNMKTHTPEDKKMLQERLELLIGSESKVNQIINQLSMGARIKVFHSNNAIRSRTVCRG
jgi:hypothetical protein